MAQLLNLSLVPVSKDGVFVSGALLKVYATGTSTPVTTYTSAALSTAHAWPVVANADGKFPPVYLADSATVRAVVQTATGGTISNGDIDPASDTLRADIVAALDEIDVIASSRPLTPFDFGAVGDGTTDDTAALAAMATAANALFDIASEVLTVKYYPRILFPPCRGFRTTATLSLRAGVEIEMQSPLLVATAANAPIVGIHYTDERATDFQSPRDVSPTFWVERITQSDWSSESDIGVLVTSAYVSRIRIRRAWGFCKGFDVCMGYGELHLGDIRNCKISDIGGRGSPEQFTNHFRAIGGTFACQANPGQSRYGIRIKPGTATGANTFLLDGQSYELGLNIAQSSNPSAETIAITADGTANELSSIRAINQRFEFSGRTHLRVIGQVRNVELGVLDAEREYVNPTSLFVDDQSTGGGGIWAYRHHGVTGPAAKSIWYSSLLKDRVVGITGSLASIVGLEAATNVGAAPATQTFAVTGAPPTFDADGFMEQVTGVRWGTRVELNGARSIGVSGVKKTATNIELNVLCFNAAGAQLTATGTVWTEQSAPVCTTGVFGGVFAIGLNDPTAASARAFEGIIHFASTVATAFIAVLGPHRKWSISSFAGQAEPFGATSHLTGQYAATAIPVAVANVTYKLGQTAVHIDAASGQPSGWRFDGTNWLPLPNLP